MEYAGPLPLKLLETAQARARRWNAKSSLREVRGSRWEIDGDPDTKEATKISVPEWQYTFVADDKALVVKVTAEGDNAAEDEKAFQVMQERQPFDSWNVDVDEAVKIASKNGSKARIGPWLRVFQVDGKPSTIWVIPSVRGALVDARTGSLVDPDQVIKE